MEELNFSNEKREESNTTRTEKLKRAQEALKTILLKISEKAIERINKNPYLSDPGQRYLDVGKY